MGSKFSVGDRVTLIPHASWCQPWRKFAEEGREATVEAIKPEYRLATIKIVFDVKRNGAVGKVLWCGPSDLVHALTPTQGDEA